MWKLVDVVPLKNSLSDTDPSPGASPCRPTHRSTANCAWASVGGGQGAFIGRVHATAAVLDNRAALVAGALSSDPAKAKASAPDYDIPRRPRLRLLSRR